MRYQNLGTEKQKTIDSTDKLIKITKKLHNLVKQKSPERFFSNFQLLFLSQAASYDGTMYFTQHSYERTSPETIPLN